MSLIPVWIFVLTQLVACTDPLRCDPCGDCDHNVSEDEAVGECDCSSDNDPVDGDATDIGGEGDSNGDDEAATDGDLDAEPEQFEDGDNEADTILDGDVELDWYGGDSDSDSELPVTSGYFDPGDFEPIPFCSDLVRRYSGTWQVVHPQPFPYANMGLIEVGGRSIAIGEGGVALWERDQYEDWRLLPPIQPEGVDTVGWTVFACVDGICAPAEDVSDESACAVVVLGSDDCWQCVMEETNPLQPEYTLFSWSMDDGSIGTSSTRSGIQRRSIDGLMRKERVICRNPRHCHIHQVVEGTNYGFGLGGPLENIPALYVLTDGEWVETQYRGQFLNGYFAGAFPRPLVFDDAAYFYTRAYSDGYDSRFTYRLDFDEGLLEPVRLSDARWTFGGLAAFGMGFLGGPDGWVTVLGSDGGIWADRILPGHVYQFTSFDDLLWAMGLGFVASFNPAQGWRILTTKPMGAPSVEAHYLNREIVAVAGEGLDHYFSLLLTQPDIHAIPLQIESGPPATLVERSVCEERVIPLEPFGMTNETSLAMGYERETGLLIVGQNRTVAILKPSGEGFHYATMTFPQGEQIRAIEALPKGKLTLLNCDRFGTCRFQMLALEVGASGLLVSPRIVNTSAPFQLNDSGRDVTALKGPYVFCADNERGIVWDHTENTISVESYPSAFTSVGPAIRLEQHGQDEGIIISGFEGGFLVREENGTYRWDSSADAGLPLPEIVEHDGCLFSANLMMRCNSTDGWKRSLRFETYNNSPLVRHHLDKLGEVLVRYGWEEQLLGRAPGTDGTYPVQCPSIEATTEAELEQCETSCSSGGTTPEPECTNGECHIAQASFCLNDCREVTVSDFYLDRFEVTNAEYADCVANGACTTPYRSDLWEIESYYRNPVYDRFPVAYINHDQAVSYCAWVEKRLPTEAEWVLAAYGREGNTYSFQGLCEGEAAADSVECAAYGMNHSGPVEVGSLANDASPYGVANMAGNVAEWLADNWDPHDFFESEQTLDPIGPASGEWKVVRGGHWAGGSVDLILRDSRDAFQPDYKSMTIGFRCAVSDNTE